MFVFCQVANTALPLKTDLEVREVGKGGISGKRPESTVAIIRARRSNGELILIIPLLSSERCQEGVRRCQGGNQEKP